MTATAAPPVPPGQRQPPVAAAPDPQRTARLRQWAVSVALVVVAFVQAPGLIAPDTKADLSVDPWGFLHRALHLWEPLGFSGQLQNQAYGYLFPMGPFFAIAHTLEVPGWVTQRLWWALLLLLAFHGARRLIAALRVGSPTTGIIAALAFALSARFVTVIGGASVEVWPMAVAPWVLAPLVTGSRTGSERRAAAWSALAVLALGGVNAVASGAALVLPVWWLLTRSSGPRRRRLSAWWLGLTAAATAWWVLPLLLLGRYSPPFLDWIESASVTTAPMSLVNVMRGTTDWVAFVGDARGAIWPAGAALVGQPLLVLNGVVIAALGVAGLARPRLPERTFLVGGLLIGVALMTLGHDGAWSPPWWPQAQGLLDGGLAPLRNLHKFQLLVEIPLAVGLAHLLSAVRLRPLRRWPQSRSVLSMVAVVALVGAATPALAGRLAQPGSYQEIPQYWRQTADWLGAHAGSGTALVVPGAKTPVSYWGDSQDEPLQTLATSPWSVRNGVPLSSAGNIRVLDAVEASLAGSGDPGLSSFLARAGVKYLVVRNDLDRVDAGAPRPMVVASALQASGGFQLVAWFGPALGGADHPPDLVVDSGLDDRVPAIEIFRVSAYQVPVVTTPMSEVVDVVGGPESLLPLTDNSVLGHQATVLDADRPPALTPGATVITDGMRRSEVDFGSMRDNRSSTMTATQPFQLSRPVHDFLPFDPTGRQTTVRYDRGTTLSASSSAADAGAWTAVDPAAGPYSAFDDDPRTAWRPAAGADPVGQWVDVRWNRPRVVTRLPVTLWHQPGGPRISEVEVTTDEGSRRTVVAGDGRIELLNLAAGATHIVTVTVTAVSGSEPDPQVGVIGVDLPGAAVRRSVVVPAAEGPWRPTLYSFSAGVTSDGCLTVGATTRCSPELVTAAEEDSGLDRTFVVPRSGTFTAFGRVQPLGGPNLDHLLVPLGPALVAGATSTLTPAPAVRPQAAVDDDLSTAWIAGADDPAPRLVLRWPGKRLVSEVQIFVDANLPASRPTRVRISGRSDGVGGVTAHVSRNGYVTFPSLRTDHLSVTVVQTRTVGSVDPRTAAYSRLPAGISEIRLVGTVDQRRSLDPSSSTGLPCGSAPALQIDGTTYQMRAEGTLGAVLAGRTLRWLTCDPHGILLAAGRHRLVAPSVPGARPVDLVLAPVGLSLPDRGVGQPDVVRWTAVDRVIDVPTRQQAQLLQVHENANPGWRATLDGTALTPVRVDGWQQGWLLPAGAAGTVHLTFGPDHPYRWSLLLGALLALLVVGVAVRPGRESARRALSERPRRAGWWALGLAVVASVGWLVGLVLTAVTGGVARDHHRVRAALRLVAPLSLLAAGLVVVARPGWQLGDSAGARTVGLLVLVSLAALWAVGLRSADEGAQPQGGPLDDGPADRGRRDRQRVGDHQDEGETSTEERHPEHRQGD